ncbi:esterase/lipase family protein [Streptomyces sp. NPDC020799]|uniref:esterase/lipase family protein n=1 Tax=Streptomyces sp. NPDC020799 TaxID=3365091 RepID=UPI0037B05613
MTPSATENAANLVSAGGGALEFAARFAESLQNPMMLPAGANEWNCKHCKVRPYPVVLIHGTWENAYNAWSGLVPVLKAEGHCVFALNFGAFETDVLKGRNAIRESSIEVANFVDKVLKSTGASKVNIVGHSQGGGVLPRWYLKYGGGAGKVNHLVGISPSNHGTTVSGLAVLENTFHLLSPILTAAGPATGDQLINSAVNSTLDAPHDTVENVNYTTIVSRSDEIVTPFTRQYLTAGPGAMVDNLTLQDFDPLDVTNHLGTLYNNTVYDLVLNALSVP